MWREEPHAFIILRCKPGLRKTMLGEDRLPGKCGQTQLSRWEMGRFGVDVFEVMAAHPSEMYRRPLDTGGLEGWR